MKVTVKFVTEDYALVCVDVGGHRLELDVSVSGDFTLYSSRMESEATRRNWPMAVGNVREEENS